MPLMSSGVELGNLREHALSRMKGLGLAVAMYGREKLEFRQEIHNKIRPCNLKLIQQDYAANGGRETFLSYEDPIRTFSDCCVRKISDKTHRPKLKGFGQLLMEEAARIAFYEHKSEKVVFISGIRTRDYYRKLGYESDGPYMGKSLSAEDFESDL